MVLAIEEANQDFSKVTQIAEEQGYVVLLENDRPKYPVIDPDKMPQIEMFEDRKLTFVATRILHKHKAALAEPAKND